MNPLRIAAFFFVLMLSAFALQHTASAQPRPITVKIHGTVNEAPAEGRPRATWRMRIDAKEVKLFVTKLEIIAGSVTDAEVIRQLRVSRGLMIAQGPAAALKTILDTPEGGSIAIQGTMRWTDTPAILLVSTVEPGA